MPPNPKETPALHDRALQDLSFIRRTMEGAASFTDVPGWGLVGVGSTALVAAPIAAQQSTPVRWISVWMITAVVAVGFGSAAMLRKMRRRVTTGEALQFTTPTRKFLFGFWPAILVGAVLTAALTDPFTPGIEAHVTSRLLPGLWLLLYGLGVMTAGAYSIRAVPLMGMVFMALGTITLLVPFAIGDVMMALGFGLLQLAFGIHIARRHGG
ncbi:MAG: hypothetical protein IBJ03_02505 [Gemmatimonadaceae bacterium]|nr:hypothetical protein [Gemmatimonadaceae bacterium]